MSYATRNGVEVEPVRPVGVSIGAASAVRLVMLVKMRRRRLSWRLIAAILNAPVATLHRMYESLTSREKDAYASTPIGGLIGEVEHE